MDNNGDASPVLGQAAFGGDIDAQVAGDRPAHRVVIYFSNFLRGVVVYALRLVSCKLEI